MTLTDLQLLIPIAGGALFGLRRGLILGIWDLVALAVSFILAAVGFQPVTQLFAKQPDWPVSFGVFATIVVLTQIAFGLFLTPYVRRLRRLITPTFFLQWLDIGGGILPGAAKGLLLAGIVLVALGVWPIVPAARTLIAESAVGKQLLPYTTAIVPYVADIVGRMNLPLPAAQVSAAGQTSPVPAVGTTSVDSGAEDEILALINDERKKAGLAPLTLDSGMRTVARGYSEELFRAGRFDHQSPVSGSPGDRLRRGGVTFSVAGENLAYAPTARMAHAGLMASEGHRANILSPRYKRIGIGVVASPSRGLVITQNFAD